MSQDRSDTGEGAQIGASQTWWVHRLGITHPRELDRQLQSWLRRSYRLIGMQERRR